MARIVVESTGAVGAPAELVYRLIADDAHHQRFLPEDFVDFKTLEGGVGAGTRHTFTSKAGGRTRAFDMDVSEPEPGRVIQEADRLSSIVTTFTVDGHGDHCHVTLHSTWTGAGGVGGIFERLFAPRVLKRVYAEELGRLDAYAREQHTAT